MNFSVFFSLLHKPDCLFVFSSLVAVVTVAEANTKQVMEGMAFDFIVEYVMYKKQKSFVNREACIACTTIRIMRKIVSKN